MLIHEISANLKLSGLVNSEQAATLLNTIA